MRVPLALACLVACGPPVSRSPQVPAEVLHYDEDFVASSTRLRATLARDGIQLDTQPVIRACEQTTFEHDCARCDVATMLDQIDPELIDGVAIAFARYPTSVRKAARLEHVAFCRAIAYEGRKNHRPAGLADPSEHRVFISVEYFRQIRGDGFTIIDAVHHEVFHLLDFAALGASPLGDSEWSALNPPGFMYLGQDKSESADAAKRPQGFVDTYAMTNEIEDRASTFEYLMVRPGELCDVAARDPVLAKKVRLLWQRVKQVEGADRLGVTAPCVKPTKPTKKPKRAKKLKLTLGSATSAGIAIAARIAR